MAPGWEVEVPEGLTLYRSDSNTTTIALRIRIEGPEDTEAVVQAQHGFRLTSLAHWLAGDARPAPKGSAPEMARSTHDLASFTTLTRLLDHNRPYARDTPIVHLIEHAAARYSVQSSDPGLVFDDDGGLTISVGPDAPAHVRNWVGTAPGHGFRLNFRVYLPRPEVISPNTVEQFLPPVLPVDGSPAAS